MNLANTPVRLDSNGYLVVSIGAGSTALFANGSISAPSIAFQTQPGTGFYWNGASDMRVTVNGNDEMRWFLNGVMWRGDGVVGFATAGTLSTFDAALTRVSNGTIAVGTGGAGSTNGTINLTSIAMAGKATFYNGVAVTGQGLPSIYGANRVAATTAAVTFLTGYTSGAADESLEISANILITTHGSEAITIAVNYTDESNAARVFTLPLTSLAGAVAPTAGAAGPFSNAGQHIRVKQTTAVSMATTGTFTGATYNVDGSIKKIA